MMPDPASLAHAAARDDYRKGLYLETYATLQIFISKRTPRFPAPLAIQFTG
jgi:hypothetical protein